MSTKVPAVISRPPNSVCQVIFSFKMTNANIMLMTTLDLSIGTTLLASPSWSAR